MKNFIIALIVLCICLASNTYAGECANGSCVANKAARKTISVTRNVVRVPVVVGQNTIITTRDIIKSQPVRSRILNRSTTIINQ